MFTTTVTIIIFCVPMGEIHRKVVNFTVFPIVILVDILSWEDHLAIQNQK